MAIHWYYKREGHCFGPYTAKEFKDLALSGELMPTDLIRRDGMPEFEWVLGGKIEGLFPKDSVPPPKGTLE